jgi:hypothetical protein
MLVQRVILLPPDAEEGWDGRRAQAVCGLPLHPHPRPPPSQGEGNLCAKLMGSDLDKVLGTRCERSEPSG